MSYSNGLSVYSLGTTQVIVPAGATNAVLITPQAGQLYTRIKYGSGGSLEIIGVPDGVTYSAAQLNTLSGNHYIVGTTEIISLEPGQPRFYMSASNVTTTVFMIRGLS